jgi:hypothetical protein
LMLQDPETPWHLHCVTRLDSTACRTDKTFALHNPIRLRELIYKPSSIVLQRELHGRNCYRSSGLFSDAISTRTII